MRGAEAVGAGVAAADNDDVLARSGDRRFDEVALLHAIRDRQVLHRLVDTTEMTPGDGQVPRHCRTNREHDGVVSRFQFACSEMDADLHPRPEPGSFGRHLRKPAVENGLLHLEFRDAVAQQAPDAVGAFIHGDRVAGARQLLRSGQAGRT